MQVSLIQATHRFLAEHHSPLAGLFENKAGEEIAVPYLTTLEMAALVDLLEVVELSEGSRMVYGTEYLGYLRRAWTHILDLEHSWMTFSHGSC